jgi:uncharacterized protein (DUF2336 family)
VPAGSTGPGGGRFRAAFSRLLGPRADASVPANADEAKRLARDRDPAVRLAVATAPDALPELLYFLARDPSADVRTAVASHPRTPRQADLLLALDEIAEVRSVIARKITGQIDSLDRNDAAQLWQLTISVLEALARDDIPQVRRLIAEAARGIAEMPQAMMTALGRDQVFEVALPALDFVGRIADEDLVEIIIHAPDPRIVGAVARRPAIGTMVADAVVESGDQPAIASLLRNHSAQIAPATLERIVELAPPIEAWHEPLVKRPQLTEAVAIRLASFVTQKLAKFLQGRPEFAPEINGTITMLVRHRHAAAAPAATVEDAESPLGRARRHYAAGTLSESLVTEALDADRDFVIAALSLRSRLPPAVVNKILMAHSAKGLTALAWKAGFSMRLAFQLQMRIAHLPPKARLSAATGGTFPLSAEEMDWQLDFFRTLVPADP